MFEEKHNMIKLYNVGLFTRSSACTTTSTPWNICLALIRLVDDSSQGNDDFDCKRDHESVCTAIKWSAGPLIRSISWRRPKQQLERTLLIPTKAFTTILCQDTAFRHSSKVKCSPVRTFPLLHSFSWILPRPVRPRNVISRFPLKAFPTLILAFGYELWTSITWAHYSFLRITAAAEPHRLHPEKTWKSIQNMHTKNAIEKKTELFATRNSRFYWT